MLTKQFRYKLGNAWFGFHLGSVYKTSVWAGKGLWGQAHPQACRRGHAGLRGCARFAWASLPSKTIYSWGGAIKIKHLNKYRVSEKHKLWAVSSWGLLGRWNKGQGMQGDAKSIKKGDSGIPLAGRWDNQLHSLPPLPPPTHILSGAPPTADTACKREPGAAPANIPASRGIPVPVRVRCQLPWSTMHGLTVRLNQGPDVSLFTWPLTHDPGC